MLTNKEDDGYLIDFDLAIKLDQQKASGAPNKTGTKVFMAIGALLGKEHSFMHDLESFFWVLLWVCEHWNGPSKQLAKAKHDSWNYQNTSLLAEGKLGYVNLADEHGYTSFTPYCKMLRPCIQQLYKVVFPQNHVWVREDRELYSQIKFILEEAKKKLN